MDALLKFLSTTTGIVVALAALLTAIGGIATAIVKLFGTRARLTKLEKALSATLSRIAVLERKQRRLDNQAQVDAKVESMRTSLLPEHADADDVEELRAELRAHQATYLAEMRELSQSFVEIRTTLRHLMDGKLKIQ